MTRKEMYAKIKNNAELARTIRLERGNYTNLSNDALMDYILLFEPKVKEACCKKQPKDNNLQDAFVQLVNILRNYRIISDYNAKAILDLL